MPTARQRIETPGEGRFLEEDEGVEGVAVLAEGVLDEAVVGRVLSGREEHPVEPDPAGLMIHFILVALPFGYLNDNVELHCHFLRSSHPSGPGVALVSRRRN